MKNISKRFSVIAESMTLAITAKAKMLKSEGHDVVSFSAGEPDFNTPENIRKRAIERINEGGNGYTAATGIPELKAAICNKLHQDNGLSYRQENIVVSNGAKHCISNILFAICNPGDEVIIPSPYWVSYYELVRMASAEPVLVNGMASNDFKVTPESLEKAVTTKTKAIMINSPNNPTGSVYTEKELRAIGEIAVANDLYIISDEIYEKLIYDRKHVSIASLDSRFFVRTIVINGLSKAYAMTGWRIGYSASSAEVAKMITKMQSHQTSNPNTIAQYAAVEALTGDQSAIETMRVAFQSRRDMMADLLDNIPHIQYIKPEGAFYIMVDVSSFYNESNQIHGSLDFSAKLLEEQMVAVIPGIAFGADDYIRLSYATNRETIEKGLKRIQTFLETKITVEK